MILRRFIVMVLQALHVCRILLAPCLEALVLLDRLAFLAEKAHDARWNWCGIVPLFDAARSPRNCALIALKK